MGKEDSVVMRAVCGAERCMRSGLLVYVVVNDYILYQIWNIHLPRRKRRGEVHPVGRASSYAPP